MKTYTRAGVSAPALSLLLATAALAQVAPTPAAPGDAGKNPEETIQLEVFNVQAERDVGYQAANSITATKFATATKNVPVTINIFTEDFMRDIDAVDVADVLVYATGLNAAPSSTQEDITYVSRGFPQNVNSVQLRNGIRKSGLLDSAGQTRVEFMKGPTSVLNGIMSPGGTTNVITKKPKPEFGGSIEQGFGTHGYLRTVVDFTGPVFANPDNGKYGSLYYRVAASHTKDGDWREFSDKEKNYLYAVVVYRWGTGTQVTYDFEDSVQKGLPAASAGWYVHQVTGERLAPPLPRDFNRSTPENWSNFGARNHVIDIEQKLGAHFTLRGAYQYQTRVRDQFRYNGNINTTRNNELTRTAQHDVQKNFNQRWYLYAFGQFDLGASTRLKTILGWENQDDYFTLWQSRHQPFGAASGPAAPAPWLVDDPRTWDRNVRIYQDLRPGAALTQDLWGDAYFAVNQLSLLKEKVFLTASIRRDITQNNNRNIIPNTVFTLNPELTHDSPQYGALWRVHPDVAVYANYGESFIYNGGLRTNPDRSFSPFEPTLGKGWEAGVKTDFLDGRISSNLAYFDIEQSNLPRRITVPDPTGLPGSTFNADVQSGLEKATGVEFNVNAALPAGLQVLAGYSYLDAFVKSNSQTPALEGTPLQGAPQHKVNAFVRYNLPRHLVKGAYVTLGYIWQDETKGSSDTRVTRIPGWESWSAGGGYNFKAWQRNWQLRVSMSNLFDEYYWPNTGAPGSPFNFKTTLRVEF